MNMNAKEKVVSTVETLIAAAKDNNAQDIVVHGNLLNVPSINLMPGQSLRGDGAGVGITVATGKDGLRLSSDNRVHNIRLDASLEKRAIFNDTSAASLGRIELRGVTTTCKRPRYRCG
jgi:hypothetical protein